MESLSLSAHDAHDPSLVIDYDDPPPAFLSKAYWGNASGRDLHECRLKESVRQHRLALFNVLRHFHVLLRRYAESMQALEPAQAVEALQWTLEPLPSSPANAYMDKLASVIEEEWNERGRSEWLKEMDDMVKAWQNRSNGHTSAASETQPTHQ